MSDRDKPINKSIEEFSDEEVEEWFEAEDESSEEAEEEVDIVKQYTEAQLRIVRSSMDFSLHNLRQSLGDSSYINLAPPYQRRHRWDIKKKSQLIESLLLNIPIPPIFLFENDYNQYEIMDGRQRLEAIKDFFENIYALRGMEYWHQLNGYRFNELPPTIQRGILRRTVSATVLLAETSRPGESEIDVRMALFKRLNTGGVQLNPQELRNALFPSAFNEMLFALSRGDVFRDTWRIPRFTADEIEAPPRALIRNALYKNMADCELVLRFFAIKETIVEGLKGSLRQLMNRTMQSHCSDNETQIDALETEYKLVLQFLYETFDETPFVLPKTKRPSRPAYDALMVATTLIGVDNLGERKPSIVRNFIESAEDPDQYEILVGRGNTVESIKDRVQLAQDILSN